MPHTSLARLFVLDLGLFNVYGPRDGHGRPRIARTIGIPGFLLQMRDGANMLIDCGFRSAYAEDVIAASAEDRLNEFGELVNYSPRQNVAGQLALLGLAPRDIDTIVLTHTHIDHIGGLGQFSHCAVCIQAAERALARPLYFDAQSRFEWPAVRSWRALNGDFQLAPGLRVLHTPGHSAGHQSLLLDLPECGAMILAGDALDRPALFAEGFANDEARRSAERLRAIAKEHNAFLIYGHDPAQWPLLRKAPDGYA